MRLMHSPSTALRINWKSKGYLEYGIWNIVFRIGAEGKVQTTNSELERGKIKNRLYFFMVFIVFPIHPI